MAKKKSNKKGAVIQQQPIVEAVVQPVVQPVLEVVQPQVQEEEKETATSPPVVIKKNRKRKKKETSEDEEEEIFGSIDEELETYRSIPFPKAVLESLLSSLSSFIALTSKCHNNKLQPQISKILAGTIGTR